MSKIKNPKICPKCGSSKVVPIVYGLPLENLEKPGDDLFGAEKRGEVELGGCLVHTNNPNFRCKACGEAFK